MVGGVGVARPVHSKGEKGKPLGAQWGRLHVSAMIHGRTGGMSVHPRPWPSHHPYASRDLTRMRTAGFSCNHRKQCMFQSTVFSFARQSVTQ